MSSKTKNLQKERKELSIKSNNAMENISNEESNNNKNKNPSTNIRARKITEDNSPNNNNNKNKNKKLKQNKKEIEDPKINNENEVEEEEKEEKRKVVTETKVVNELPKNDVLENKIQKVFYKIDFVFNNQDNLLTVKPELKIINAFKKFCKKINIPLEKLSLNYKEHEITEKYYDLTVKEFFNFPKNKARPIIYVKVKPNISSNSNNNNLGSDYNAFYKRSYDNKIKLTNYPSMTDINVTSNDDLYNVINTFLKDTGISSDFTCERKEEKKNKKTNNENDINSNSNEDFNNILEENKVDSNLNNNIAYYIGFPSPDIAFDFNRYMNSLRLMNPTFKNLKIQVLLSKKKTQKVNKQMNDEQNDSKRSYKNYRYGSPINLDEKDLEKRNIEILNVIRNNFLNNKMNGLIKGNNNYNYLSNSSPYTTPYDERIKDMHENKKKWLNPRGFISSVNKYSGVHI